METLHPREIELGLVRVEEVRDRLGLAHPAFAVITVSGTNGKGSTVAMLEQALHAAGYRVGAYTSPHLIEYNERVRIATKAVDDAELCAAFERVEAERLETPLTYFEFGTLAAIDCFRQRKVEIAILEVGLGGRLDAVNAWDADVSIVSSVGIDHTEWLGPDRESIGREKAGIYRAQRCAICGDPDPPHSLIEFAEQIDARLLCVDRDFDFERLARQLDMARARQKTLWTALPGNAWRLPAVQRRLHDHGAQLPRRAAFRSRWRISAAVCSMPCCLGDFRHCQAGRCVCWMLRTMCRRSRRWRAT